MKAAVTSGRGTRVQSRSMAQDWLPPSAGSPALDLAFGIEQPADDQVRRLSSITVASSMPARTGLVEQADRVAPVEALRGAAQLVGRGLRERCRACKPSRRWPGTVIGSSRTWRS